MLNSTLRKCWHMNIKDFGPINRALPEDLSRGWRKYYGSEYNRNTVREGARGFKARRTSTKL